MHEKELRGGRTPLVGMEIPGFPNFQGAVRIFPYGFRKHGRSAHRLCVHHKRPHGRGAGDLVLFVLTGAEFERTPLTKPLKRTTFGYGAFFCAIKYLILFFIQFYVIELYEKEKELHLCICAGDTYLETSWTNPERKTLAIQSYSQYFLKMHMI